MTIIWMFSINFNVSRNPFKIVYWSTVASSDRGENYMFIFLNCICIFFFFLFLKYFLCIIFVVCFLYLRSVIALLNNFSCFIRGIPDCNLSWNRASIQYFRSIWMENNFCYFNRSFKYSLKCDNCIIWKVKN